ncbi:MAG TPA: MFS transporter, partial [Limnochorda sp.]
QLASIPFLLLMAYSYHLPLVVGAYYMRHILMNMSWPVADAFILEQVRPDQRATLTSLDTMLGSLGRGGLGPVVSGWMQMRWDFTGAFTLTTVAYVVGALLFYLFFHGVEEPETAPAPVTTATR